MGYSFGSHPQQQGGHAEVGQQGDGVHQGGDEGAGHDSGVQAQPLGQDGQAAAYQLGRQHRHRQGQAHRRRHGRGHGGQERQAQQVHRRQHRRPYHLLLHRPAGRGGEEFGQREMNLLFERE